MVDRQQRHLGEAGSNRVREIAVNMPGCVLGGDVRAPVTEIFTPSSRCRLIQS
jgi:hypothetical protein